MGSSHLDNNNKNGHCDFNYPPQHDCHYLSRLAKHFGSFANVYNQDDKSIGDNKNGANIHLRI